MIELSPTKQAIIARPRLHHRLVSTNEQITSSYCDFTYHHYIYQQNDHCSICINIAVFAPSYCSTGGFPTTIHERSAFIAFVLFFQSIHTPKRSAVIALVLADHPSNSHVRPAHSRSSRNTTAFISVAIIYKSAETPLHPCIIV